uniref:GEO13441p1 n=1 Tax=Drosophila melanogaster TaxID=7227 RepID=D6W4R4_DROME|eukprot:NP_001247073.1 uncharacterized protein Dmel_CG43450 [Drosophila melanogaster]
MNLRRTPCPQLNTTATTMKKCVIACSSFGSPSTSCCSHWPRLFSSSAW